MGTEAFPISYLNPETSCVCVCTLDLRFGRFTSPYRSDQHWMRGDRCLFTCSVSFVVGLFAATLLEVRRTSSVAVVEDYLRAILSSKLMRQVAADYCSVARREEVRRASSSMAMFAKILCCAGGIGGDVADRKGSTWRIFSLKELHAATNNFNYDNKLGEGGFGSVYWGQLWDGSQIAVKRLKVWSTKAEMEFAVEVEILGRVRHKNLLSLRGYCAEGQERLIVYDYMANLSLLSHLHGQYASDSFLDWRRRMSIAIGSAEGLAYLHHFATPHIIHRDVKASNVLLDSNFDAQVADFGFAKLIPDGATHVTTRVKGTLGYLAPEYAMWGKVSESCDVYSFGILLLELISGKKPIEKLGPGTKRTIVEWAAPLVFHGKLDELVDPKLKGRFAEEELRRVVQVATMCAQNTPDNRPTMLEVVELLKGENSREDPILTKQESAQRDPKKLKLDTVKYGDELLAADEGSESNSASGPLTADILPSLHSSIEKGSEH